MAGSEAGLLAKAGSYDLTGDPARPGFVLVSVQGRNLRFPTAAPRDGQHHDFYYRDLRSPSSNPDIANTDALIDAMVQEGIVDTNRIYVAGWSNGAFFSQLYAIARDDTATAAGNRVADCSTAPLSDACLSLVNHLRWPDGVYNNPPSGADREVDMLQFLAAHPRP